MHKIAKQTIILILLAVAGLAIFIILLDDFFPYRAANMRIGRSQSIEVARDFMEEQEYDLEGYHLATVMGYDAEAFIYLQKKFGFKAAQDMLRYKTRSGYDFYWRVFWFENLPRNAPQERYAVLISGAGNIVGFHHEVPYDMTWPNLDRAHLEQEEALQIALRFLGQRQIDLSNFQRGIFTSQKQENKTNYTFKWRNESDFDASIIELIIRVQGDEVGFFELLFRLPEDEATAIKQQSSNEYFFKQVIPITVLFLIGLFLFGIFLKKYHEGEVEVRTGGLVFLTMWIAFLFQAILKFRMKALDTTLGELSYDGVALFIFIILVLIVRPFLSIFGFMAWSVGESLGRERFSVKFTAVDGIINGRFSTLEFARSLFQGYCAGFYTLGLIAILFYIALEVFGCTTRITGYQNILPVSYPFFIPVLVAITGSLLSELVFRLFGNFILYKYLKAKIFAVIISAALWAFFVPTFWEINVSLYPIDYEMIVWFVIGLFFSFIFWKFDILTVIIANFVTIGVMRSLPLITSKADSLISLGIIALAILCIPIIFMVRGFIKKEKFTYKIDLVPGHIKRITERVRMVKELEIARQVQMRLLPKKSPHVPGFEISGACVPARETGGDYFDFIELGKSRLGIVIGDVSGKGVPAAIYMTLTKGIVQSHADDFISPKNVLVKVNNLLYKTIDRDSFVSLFYAVLDIEKRTIVYSRAGHNPVLYFRKEEGKCHLLEPDGIALGLEKGVVFERVIREKEIQLYKDDLLVFYTDGFTEAMNRRMEEYSEKRLMNIIQKNCSKSVDEIYDAVLKDNKAFVKDMPQQDDMTMIFIKGR